MKSRVSTWGCIGVAALLLAACGKVGSGTSASSDTSTNDDSAVREVSGTVPTGSESAASVSKHLGGGGMSFACAADEVIATDTDGSTISTVVEDDCSFILKLRVGHSYVIGLSHDGTFIAALKFRGRVAGFRGSGLAIGRGNGRIALGGITVSGSTGSCENDPSEFIDQDDDGVADASDDDADGDGSDDAFERDCSLDGVEDDSDENACDGEAVAEDDVQAHVLRVRPWHGRKHVALRKRVRALISCRVNPLTVNAQTFRVESSDGDAIACHYRLLYPFFARLTRITCRHFADPFTPETVYTATLDGVECRDGRPVEVREWSWTTRDAPEADAGDEAADEASDDGDEEDLLDEADEAEDTTSESEPADEEEDEDEAEADDATEDAAGADTQ
ncbi:MAG: hypothetical protein HY696_08895 [Deltaproteobacteria bacterium]|nr:hypothetical protein [Deltaproteobacteria bacterium]